MTQTDRDRLVALKKAKDKKITQRQAAEELQLSERQVRRLPAKLRTIGDTAVIHGMRNRSSNRRLGGRNATMTELWNTRNHSTKRSLTDFTFGLSLHRGP